MLSAVTEISSVLPGGDPLRWQTGTSNGQVGKAVPLKKIF